MKILIKTFFFCLFGAILFVACSRGNSPSSLSDYMRENGKVKVLSTIAQIGDLVQAIGGERVDHLVLIPKGLDPHSYELVKGDGEKLSRANLIFYNGLGLEHGASLSAFLASHQRAVPVSDEVKKQFPEKILQKNGVEDPHIWMDVSLWEAAAVSILKNLSEQDPEGAPYYKERAAQCIREMQNVNSYIHTLLQDVPEEKRFLVTSHDAFSYFVKSYLAAPEDADWQKRFTAPEGLAPDGQINPMDIRRTIAFLREHQIHVIFPESNVSRDVSLKIAKASAEMGFSVTLCNQPLYGDSTGGLSYVEMMRRNAEIITKELGEVR